MVADGSILPMFLIASRINCGKFVEEGVRTNQSQGYEKGVFYLMPPYNSGQQGHAIKPKAAKYSEQSKRNQLLLPIYPPCLEGFSFPSLCPSDNQGIT